MAGTSPRDRARTGARAGLIGPTLFVATFTLEGWLRPGYHAREMFVSALALGPRGWIQIANFLVFGALFLVFTRGVAAELPDGKASRAGPILLTIIALSLFVSGPLVMDPATTPRDQMSWHGLLHGIFGALVFSLSPASCFVFLRRFRADPAWRSMRGWTLAAGAVIAAAVVLLSAGKSPAVSSALHGWVGAIQRTALVTYCAWLFTFALVLHRRTAR